MNRKSQTGFSLTETLLVLILLAIIGFTGFYVYHANQAANNTLTSNASSSEPKATTADASLTITEWGVKLPLSADLTGAAYTYHKVEGAEGYIDVTLLDSECDPMFTITRGTATETDPTTDSEGEGGNPQTYAASKTSKHVGNYYYAKIDGNGSTCFKGEAMEADKATGVKTRAVYGQIDTAFNAMTSVESH